MKNPGTAAVLSFIFNGLGHLYNGQIKKGLWLIFLSSSSIIIVVIGAATLIACFLSARSMQLMWYGIFLFAGGIAVACFIGIYSIFDSYKAVQDNQ